MATGRLRYETNYHRITEPLKQIYYEQRRSHSNDDLLVK